ncbi:MAG: hypothetical protein AAF799_01260 [Myxococcota bacterium]
MGSLFVLSLVPLSWACEGAGPGLEAEPTFACTYEVRFSSCFDPQGSPWRSECVTVRDEAACQTLTQNHVENTGDCEFSTTHRSVQVREGECGEVEEPDEGGFANGESCDALAQCASGLCVPQYYCTSACGSDAECEGDFGGGCCVGEGSLGYCLAAADCDALCPDNAYAAGLPTLCYCNEGFHWNQAGDACVPPADLGEWCYFPADCASGYCLSGFDDDGEGRRWCSTQCDDDTECAALVGVEQVDAACCGPTTDGAPACVIDTWCS